MDKLSPAQRHHCMSSVRSKNTKPEMIVRRGLWARGFRYRLNHKRLPGHPDLVLRKYRTCIFVNGCFWHGHLLNTRGLSRCVHYYVDGKRGGPKKILLPRELVKWE